MRKAISLIALLLLLLVVLVIAVMASRARSPAGWQVELDRYVEYKDSLGSGTTTVQATVRASRPWNLDEDMSSAVFADRPYYRADYDYSGDERYGFRQLPYPLSFTGPLTVELSMLAGEKGYGFRSLPYPPKDVWCVLLERDLGSGDEPGSERGHEVVFVALHRDIYCADWVVHEVTGDLFSQDLTESLSAIGCDLQLEQASGR